MRKPLFTWLFGLLAFVCAGLAAAHPMPESRVWIDTTPGGLRLTLQLPLNRLEFAYGQALADAPEQVLAKHGEGLATYLLQHVGARSGNVGWQALRPQLQVLRFDGSSELQAVLELRAPPGADARNPTLLYDAITHEVRTHRVQVFLRNDWAGGFAAQAPLLLGELNSQKNSLPVTLNVAGGGASWWRLIVDGALHIAQGSDHLLFLFLLVLVTPLRQVAWVVSAFTVGHSVTLALGSSGVLTPPAALVEVAVALSIAVAAVHALRPLFTKAELAMALGFGLIHGLAFSASLSGAGLSAWQHAQALLAFNVGIELMQLAVLAAVLPPLLMLSRHAAQLHAQTRWTVAVGAFVIAVLWALERLGLAGLDTAPATAVAMQMAPVVLGVLWLLALAVRRRGYRSS